MRRTTCFAMAAAAVTAAVFACTSSNNSSAPPPDAGSDGGTGGAGNCATGGCTSEASVGDDAHSIPAFSCGQGSGNYCSIEDYCLLDSLPDGGQTPTGPFHGCAPFPSCDGGLPTCACILDSLAVGGDAGGCTCTEDVGITVLCPAPVVFSCGQGSGGSCGVGYEYCLLDSLPDGGQLPVGPYHGCAPLPSCNGGPQTCACILGGLADGGDAGGCTCTEDSGITVSCPVFPCGQWGCDPNEEYCQLDYEPDGGLSPVFPISCPQLPSCDGGSPSCACILASRSGDGGTCSCTADDMGQLTVDCQVL